MYDDYAEEIEEFVMNARSRSKKKKNKVKKKKKKKHQQLNHSSSDINSNSSSSTSSIMRINDSYDSISNSTIGGSDPCGEMDGTTVVVDEDKDDEDKDHEEFTIGDKWSKVLFSENGGINECWKILVLLLKAAYVGSVVDNDDDNVENDDDNKYIKLGLDDYEGQEDEANNEQSIISSKLCCCTKSIDDENKSCTSTTSSQ